MANKILMPKLSPTMEEGQIARWVKNEGDAIEANETIAEVDTDKATMEMTSLEPGTLLKIIVPAGDNAKLGQTIGIIGKKGEDFSALLDDASTNGASVKSEDKAKQESETEDVPKESQAAEASAETKSAAAPEQKNVSETAGRSYDEQRPEAKEQAQRPKTEDQPQGGSGRMIVSPIAAR